MRKIGMVVGWLALAALPVSAQTAAQDEAALAALRAQVGVEAHASLVAAVRDARSRGLPTQPLIAKAQEGVAKRVPGARVVAAVRIYVDRLGQAHALLHASGGSWSAAEVSGVADALQRGVPADAVSRLVRESRGRGNVAVSAHALADLMRAGVPLAVGAEVLTSWRANGADAARLTEIPAAVDRLIRQGVIPAQAAAAIGAGLKLGRAPGSILPSEVPGILRGGGGG